MNEVIKHKNLDGEYVVYEFSENDLETAFAFVQRRIDPIKTSIAYSRRMMYDADYIVKLFKDEQRFLMFKNRTGDLASQEVLDFFKNLYGGDYLSYRDTDEYVYIEPETEETKAFLVLRGVFDGN